MVVAWGVEVSSKLRQLSCDFGPDTGHLLGFGLLGVVPPRLTPVRHWCENHLGFMGSAFDLLVWPGWQLLNSCHLPVVHKQSSKTSSGPGLLVSAHNQTQCPTTCPPRLLILPCTCLAFPGSHAPVAVPWGGLLSFLAKAITVTVPSDTAARSAVMLRCLPHAFTVVSLTDVIMDVCELTSAAWHPDCECGIVTCCSMYR